MQRQTVQTARDDEEQLVSGLLRLAGALAIVAVVVWPGFALATVGGALSGGGAWFLKKAFGK